MAEVRNWQPGWIDRARWSAQGMLAPLFGGDERAALAYVDDKVKPTLEYMPGVGDVMAAAEARDAFSQGDYLGGGLLAAGAAAGLVPGVGDAVQKGVKKGVNIVRQTPTMADAYVDDAFAGTVSVSEKHPFVSAINVEPQYRGQGIGKELYSEAEKMAGQPLFPSPLGLTDDAIKVWKKRLAAMPAEDAQKLLDMAQRAGEGYGIAPNQVAERLSPLRNALKPQGIRAYHGSPHDFDKFDMSKIGTGEGAQAYGHGLYFAEKEAVAEGYKNAGPAWKNGPIVKRIVFDAEEEANRTGKSVMEILSDMANEQPVGKRQPYHDAINNYADISKNMGRMYEVNINANPDDFLDWDKPLSEQSQPVQDAIMALNAQLPDYIEKIGPKSTGNQIEAALRWINETPGKEAAQGALQKSGIPGIKYLDAGSRSAGDGSRNYVVFDDALIEILRKYGLAGMGLLGAGMMYDGGQQEQVY